MADLNEIKALREKTGVSLDLCKKALEEGGDLEKAQDLLRKWGQQLAGKRTGRATNQGLVEPYIHANGKLGVLIDLRCETDFVAKTDDFKELAHELALHIAAANPEYVSGDDISVEMLEKEKEIYIEIKGWMQPRALIKIKEFIKQNPDIKYLLLTEKELKKMEIIK